MSVCHIYIYIFIYYKYIFPHASHSTCNIVGTFMFIISEYVNKYLY